MSSVLEEWAEADGPARNALQKEPGNEQAYAWAKKYDLLTLRGSSLLILTHAAGRAQFANWWVYSLQTGGCSL